MGGLKLFVANGKSILWHKKFMFIVCMACVSGMFQVQSSYADVTNVAKTFGGSQASLFYSISYTQDGGFVAVGDSQAFDGDMVGIAKGGLDAIVVKYDRNGNREWIDSFGGSAIDRFYEVITLADGGIVVAGYSQSANYDMSMYGLSPNQRAAVLVKYSLDGTRQWIRVLEGSGNSIFYGLAPTSDGGFVATGYSTSDDGAMMGIRKGSDTDSDAIIAKYDENGNRQWIHSFGGSEADEFQDVKQTPDGGYIATGLTKSIDNDLQNLRGNKSNLDYDAILVKYDSSGSVAWAKTFGGTGVDFYIGSEVLINGRIVATGYSSSIDGDMLGLNKGDYDAIFVIYDQTGNIQSVRSFGGTRDDFFYTVVGASDGGFVAVGSSMSTSHDLQGLNPPGGNLVHSSVIAKFDQNGNHMWTNVFWDTENYIYANEFYGVASMPGGKFFAVGRSKSITSDHVYKAVIVSYDDLGNSSDFILPPNDPNTDYGLLCGGLPCNILPGMNVVDKRQFILANKHDRVDLAILVPSNYNTIIDRWN